MARRKSARALLWLSFVLLIVGAMITDPAAGFLLFALGGLGSLAASILGDRQLKIIGVLALTISIGLVITYWPMAKAHMARYREHAKTNQVTQPLVLETTRAVK